jgi:hypothetical protein
MAPTTSHENFKISMFWDVTPIGLVDSYQSSGEHNLSNFSVWRENGWSMWRHVVW